jgi:hypothetical protein
MSFPPHPFTAVPAEMVRVARAVCPKGSVTEGRLRSEAPGAPWPTRSPPVGMSRESVTRVRLPSPASCRPSGEHGR